MITVQLIASTNQDVTTLSSHAAKVCYTADVPQMGSLIDVQSRLFNPGHHTTIEHNHFTFNLDGLSVSSVVFGIHLNSPYYNSDQRSGRFSKMYQNPDMNEIKDYLETFYPNEPIQKALSFIEKGIKIYQTNLPKITELAEQAIRSERPLANDKYIAQNSPKFAQEQLRVFLSQVMPTSLDITLNTSALCALWQVAWSPEMRLITDKMRDSVLQEQPELSYMFEEKHRQNRDWSPYMFLKQPSVKTEPTCRLLSCDVSHETPQGKNAVDILQFSPFSMNQNTSCVKTEVEISCATMGQDQRHRSIKRSEPVITGNFYIPPLLKMANLEQTAQDYMKDFAQLRQELSPALMTTLTPYGVMVKYEKNANLNALLHEQGKRLCWCAQEEISEISRQLRSELSKVNPTLADKLSPPCYYGTCHEGVRFCGRQCNKKLVPDYFIKRRV